MSPPTLSKSIGHDGGAVIGHNISVEGVPIECVSGVDSVASDEVHSGSACVV